MEDSTSAGHAMNMYLSATLVKGDTCSSVRSRRMRSDKHTPWRALTAFKIECETGLQAA